MNIFEIEREAGYYDVSGTYFAIRRKPAWLHRLAVRWILGWKWRDAE
jgi:hypothetical protein